MSIWAILKNIGPIISFFKTLSSIIEAMAKHKTVPPRVLVSKLLKEAEGLLESGVIDIEGVDEAAVADALKQIEAQLCPGDQCKV